MTFREKNITVVLKDAWHTNRYIASQVENTVVFFISLSGIYFYF